MILSPSLLSADFSRLADELAALEAAGISWLHLDIMDGAFVPNITFGQPVIKSLRKRSSKLFFDVHLMIEEPARYLESFRDAGADVLVMSVNPGFSGQKFIPQSFDKIRATRAMLNAAGAGDVLIQVDGGACPENTAQLVAAGADVLVSGSAFFGHPPYDQCHQKFQAAAQAAADNAHNARCAAAALWQPGRALKK